MRKTRICSLFLALTLVSTMTLAGCSSTPVATTESTPSTTDSASATTDSTSSAPAESSSTPEKLTELSFYMQNGPVNDFERIMTKANETIGESINAKLNLICIGTDYDKKMNLMINSGDEWDLCFTANWGGINFFENATKGAYADLTELIPTYAPKSYERIPKGLWDGVTINGKIYGVVNYQQWGVAARKGLTVRADIADELSYDWKSIKGKSTIEALKILDPFIGGALKKHPDMIGWETSANYSFFANEPLMWDMEPVGDMTSPGWVRFSEPAKVINQFETPEFKEYCDIMRDWYNKGYVRKDGATIKDTTPDRKAAKIIAACAYGWPDSIEFPGNADISKMSMCTVEQAPAYTVSTTRTVIPAAAASTAAVAINAKSKNIEKSLELIELLNTNDELYMLITQGEEGVDYVYDESGKFTQVEGKYNFNFNEWQIGQSYSPSFTRALYHRNEAGKLQQESQTIVYKADREADLSPVTGFTFDQTPIKTELTNCAAITTEMVPALSSGSVDPAKALPEFLQRLKTAGVDAIVAEKQKQYDAWLASK